jgi:hypothetical protein
MTAGVAVLGRILAALASGQPQTAGDVIAGTGVARSSGFDVLRRMEQAGLVVRDAKGLLAPGPAAGRFAYSAHGLGGLFGPARPVLDWLRDETGGSASLMAGESVLHRAAAERTAGTNLRLAICDADGRERARLDLVLASDAGEAERGRAQALVTAAARRLQDHLGDPG